MTKAESLERERPRIFLGLALSCAHDRMGQSKKSAAPESSDKSPEGRTLKAADSFGESPRKRWGRSGAV